MLAAAGSVPWIILVAGALVGWLLLTAVRRQDHATWVVARAPRLPIRVLAAGDDAWLRGAARCATPLTCPWFGVPAIAYSYTRERAHTTTTTDKDGKTTKRTTWETERSESHACDFDLDDGARIRVRTSGARNDALVPLREAYESADLRHTASVLEPDAVVSVLGVKQDDGSLAAQREVPCWITRRSPADVVRGAHRGEAWCFHFAWILPALAGAGAALSWRQSVRGPADVFAALGIGAVMALPFWAVGTYNRLVRLRQQVQAAFRQVDVDLAVRAALVPNLVAVVQGAAEHERSLLRDLAAIRAGLDPAAAVAAERGALATSRQVLVLHERHPDLRRDALYRDLHDRLWACEEKLAHARQAYNDIVKEWNDRQQQFPAVLVARLAACRPAPFFSIDDEPLPPPLRGA
jgi:LemA protein